MQSSSKKFSTKVTVLQRSNDSQAYNSDETLVHFQSEFEKPHKTSIGQSVTKHSTSGENVESSNETIGFQRLKVAQSDKSSSSAMSTNRNAAVQANVMTSRMKKHTIHHVPPNPTQNPRKDQDRHHGTSSVAVKKKTPRSEMGDAGHDLSSVRQHPSKDHDVYHSVSTSAAVSYASFTGQSMSHRDKPPASIRNGTSRPLAAKQKATSPADDNAKWN